MRAWMLHEPGVMESSPLVLEEVPEPEPGQGEIRMQVRCCGLCRTDLHIVEGELVPREYPVIPGHQIVGTVDAVGPDVDEELIGTRRGGYWLHRACGQCTWCDRDLENLCEESVFTGLDVPGGFAEKVIVRVDYSVPIPLGLESLAAAPLLCAGIIGYRSLRLSELGQGECLALFGFGASAHIVIQVAQYWGCEVVVYTRSPDHQRMAEDMGAIWVGEAGKESGPPCDRAITFAPVGSIAIEALRAVRPGGTVALNAVTMSDIPSFPYDLIYGERTLRSVANVTRQDAEAFMKLAGEIPVRTSVQPFAFSRLNEALVALKHSEIDGAAVLDMGDHQ